MSDTIKLSCFTPTHDPKYLPEVYESLQYQQHTNWEWVITPSRQAELSESRFPFLQDPRVRVTERVDSSTIGELKREACHHCTGDVFVELDHDDILAPGILTDVAAAAKAGAGFIFSDSVTFKSESLDPIAYSPSFGWQLYPVQLFERQLIATRAFPVTPRSLAEVFFAPDHVRCWSRKAYEKAGGHDKTLRAGDDHKLIVDTYLAGETFHHIEKGGYFYRRHENNSIVSHQRDIQSTSASTRHSFLPQLCLEWGRRNEYQSLNFHDTPETPEGVLQAINHVSQLKENSCSLIHLGRLLAFAPPTSLIRFVNDCYTALAPGGFLTGRVPDAAKGELRFMDPGFLSQFTLTSFQNFTHKNIGEKIANSKSRFQAVELFSHPAAGYDAENLFEITFRLSALKGQRQPGPCYI